MRLRSVLTRHAPSFENRKPASRHFPPAFLPIPSMARALAVLTALLLSAAVGAAPAANATTAAADYAADPATTIPKQLRAPPPHPPKVRV